MGTRVADCQVIKVIDGDTIDVDLNGTIERLRLAGLDTEESHAGGDKPLTDAGRLATALATRLFQAPGGGLARVDLEFDSDDPLADCLVMHRDNLGRLLCYVHVDGQNVCLAMIGAGWSPYFVKYGRSRVYHRAMAMAEAAAQAAHLGIWNPATNAPGGVRRDYDVLLSWWELRALAVEDYRLIGRPAGALSVRLDHARLRALAETGQTATVLCDIPTGITLWTGGGAVVYAGSVHHAFNLWLPGTREEAATPLVYLIQTRYRGVGRRNYVYATGPVTRHNDKPQIVLTDAAQLSDFPPD